MTIERIAVLTAALALGGTPRAAAAARAVAAEGAALAAEIGNGVGRVHDAFAARRSEDAVLEGWGRWCMNGGLRSLSARGEESLLYLDLAAEARARAARSRMKETLYAQALALGAPAGAGLASLARELARERDESARLDARAEALRRMLLGAGWAAAGPDGRLHLNPAEGADFVSAEPCDPGYDGPG